MAYKFQLGAANLSGSITLQSDFTAQGDVALENGVINTAEIADSAITQAKMAANSVDSDQYVDGSIDRVHLSADIISGAQLDDDCVDSEHIVDGAVDNVHLAGGIAITKLVEYTISGKDLGTDLDYLNVSTSGSLSMTSYNGSGASSDLAVNVDDSSIEINSNALRVKAGGVTDAMLNDDVATGLAGDGLGASSGVLAVNVDDTGIEIDSDTLRLKDLGVATAKIAADAVTGAKIADDAVDSEHIADGAIDLAHMSANSVDSDQYVDGSIDRVHLSADIIDGTKIDDDAVDSEHIALGALDSEHYSSGSVQDGHLAGDISNAKLANSSITLTQGAGMGTLGAVSLGGSITVAVDGVLEDLDSLGAASADGEFIVATGAGAFAYESGDTARTSLGLGTGDSPSFSGLTVNGDLTVTGSLTYVNTTNLAISDALITIGSGSSAFATGYGIEFGAMGDSWASLETAQYDYDTDGSTDNVLSSSLPIRAENISADSFWGNLVGNVAANVYSRTGAATMDVGVNYFTDQNSSVTATLPAATDVIEGDTVKIKAGDFTGSGQIRVEVDDADNDSIDGSNTYILLQSPYAAVSLVYVGSNNWRVF
jgi:hypothetical protein